MSDTTTHKEKYPEHQRLKAVKDRSQAAGEFVEWLHTQNLSICELDPESGERFPTYQSTERLLAAWLEIDLDKIENEKCAMLDELRAAHEDKTSE